MRKAYTIIASLLLAATIIISCNKSRADVSVTSCDSVTNKGFAADVNPIIQTFCNQANCHHPGSSNGPGQLTTYTEIFNARIAIKGQVQAGLMPQNTTLSTA